MSYKGMTSEKASRVKTVGHDRESEFAGLIAGRAIPGQGKGDVEDLYKKIHTLKAPDENQLQICLHVKGTISEVFNREPVFVEPIHNLLVLPDDVNEYNTHKKYFKQQVVKPVRNLVTLFQDPQLVRAFMWTTFFNEGEVHYLTILPDLLVFNTFMSGPVLDVLQKAIVEPSKGSNSFSEGCQKVLFKYPVGKNGRIITVGEIEIRREDKHMNKFKFWMKKNKLFELLSKHITPYQVPRDPNYCPPPPAEWYQNKLFEDHPRRNALEYREDIVYGQRVRVTICPPRKARGS